MIRSIDYLIYVATGVSMSPDVSYNKGTELAYCSSPLHHDISFYMNILIHCKACCGPKKIKQDKASLIVKHVEVSILRM